MIDFSSDEFRRDPFPLYDAIRRRSPILQVPPPFDAWMALDYESAKRILSDHDAFSSQVPAAPSLVNAGPSRGRCTSW